MTIDSNTTSIDIDGLKRRVCAEVDRLADRLIDASHQIHAHPELNYEEVFAHDLLTGILDDLGRAPERHAYGVGTAFEARVGSTGPDIAVLCEYDALPGIGHACGHNVIATAGLGAGLAAAAFADELGGRVRIMGTPAEEGGAGKAYMVRAGLFDDVDVALHWHAGDRNAVTNEPTLANKSAKFRFSGIAAHAAAAPERGRSALDGVEAMNHMANLMREHMPDDARMHYIVTRGGDAPNVVPEFAESFYYVRHRNPQVMAEIFERLLRISEGAAMGTGTTVTHEVIHGAYSLLPNDEAHLPGRDPK